jgi:hypothetical protein
MAGAEELATMILISRLTRGSVDADLRGFGNHHPETLGSERAVREMVLE